MANITAGRLTVENDQSLVVFLIGARINKWWLLPLSLPILSRMQSMTRELLADPDSGLLGLQPLGFGVSVQYWKSAEHLRRYAGDKKKEHQPTALRFMKKLFKNAAVGIWHETYLVPGGHYESLYVNMPPFGLGRTKPLLPAVGQLSHMNGRLSRHEAKTNADPTGAQAHKKAKSARIPA